MNSCVPEVAELLEYVELTVVQYSLATELCFDGRRCDLPCHANGPHAAFCEGRYGHVAHRVPRLDDRFSGRPVGERRELVWHPSRARFFALARLRLRRRQRLLRGPRERRGVALDLDLKTLELDEGHERDDVADLLPE